jgi:hypothetical protein
MVRRRIIIIQPSVDMNMLQLRILGQPVRHKHVVQLLVVRIVDVRIPLCRRDLNDIVQLTKPRLLHKRFQRRNEGEIIEVARS